MGKTILTPDQQRLLDIIIATPKITDSYYFTGGTALSEFYFQHRLSEDLDFFTEDEVITTDVLSLMKKVAVKLQIKEVEYKTLRGSTKVFGRRKLAKY